MKVRTFRIGGIHPSEEKQTASQPSVLAPLPQFAFFPLSQHIGTPARPLVSKGDQVKVGTMLAEASGLISANVFSSVSGVVRKIDKIVDATGYRNTAIWVDVVGDEWEESIDRSTRIERLPDHHELSPAAIVERIRWAGIAGMGGAGFPTAVKLTPGKPLECVILNGVECEPYITSDDQLMQEHPQEILMGLKLLMRAVQVERGYIGIEENKPVAIQIMTELTADDPRIEIVPLKRKYPQGGEKQLVDAVIHRQIPAPPALPADVGAIVQNVATAYAVYEAVMKNKPLFERYTTVTGKMLPRPSNFRVRMGTPIASLIDICGGLPEGACKVLAGGPMMGRALSSLEVPVCKGTNCVTVLSATDARRKSQQPCIRCAKCVDVCPMGLEPYLLSRLSVFRDWGRAEDEDIVSCIECGSCQFTCPSHRALLDMIRIGKSSVMSIIRDRKTKNLR